MLLALDTATQMIGLCLYDGMQVLAESVWAGRRYHTVSLAPETAIMLRRVGRSPSELTAVAVALGPGSYTGLRIGLAFAKGLALTHNLPLVGIPTLDIVARSQPRCSEPMLAVMPAGRGRIIGLWYKWERRSWKADGEIETLTWGEIAERLEEKTVICGDVDPEGRRTLADQPLAILPPPANAIRRPSFLAELALERIKAGKLMDPATLAPVYLPS